MTKGNVTPQETHKISHLTGYSSLELWTALTSTSRFSHIGSRRMATLLNGKIPHSQRSNLKRAVWHVALFITFLTFPPLGSVQPPWVHTDNCMQQGITTDFKRVVWEFPVMHCIITFVTLPQVQPFRFFHTHNSSQWGFHLSVLRDLKRASLSILLKRMAGNSLF